MRKSHFFLHPRKQSAGLSLIELMIAMTIGLLLVIGIIQIFSASRATYQMQDGVARIQENGRFITQFLQKQLRMGGFMGCGSDLERGRQLTFVNHLDTYAGNTVDDAHRFQRPVEGFAGSDTTELASLLPTGVTPLADSDVLVLRTASADSVPVLEVSQDSNHLILTATLGADAPNVFSDSSGAAIPYFLENCRSSDVFVGTLTGTSLVAIGNLIPNVYLDTSVTTCGAGGCPWDFRISNAFLNAPNGGITPTASGFAPSTKQLNAEVHRAEFTMVYVAKNNATSQPALYVRQFKRNADALADPEEMADGIEALKFLYGVDKDNDGQVDEYQTAAKVAAGATGAALDAKWGQVLSIRIGMLLRSPESAPGAVKPYGGYKVLGKDITTTPDDGHLRQVYETTIAVRNRVFTS